MSTYISHKCSFDLPICRNTAYCLRRPFRFSFLWCVDFVTFVALGRQILNGPVNRIVVRLHFPVATQQERNILSGDDAAI